MTDEPLEELDSSEFLIFSGYTFYPSGGFDDFVGIASSIETAKKWVELSGDKQWAQIVHSNTFKIVLRGELPFPWKSFSRTGEWVWKIVQEET